MSDFIDLDEFDDEEYENLINLTFPEKSLREEQDEEYQMALLMDQEADKKKQEEAKQLKFQQNIKYQRQIRAKETLIYLEDTFLREIADKKPLASIKIIFPHNMGFKILNLYSKFDIKIILDYISNYLIQIDPDLYFDKMAVIKIPYLRRSYHFRIELSKHADIGGDTSVFAPNCVAHIEIE